MKKRIFHAFLFVVAFLFVESFGQQPSTSPPDDDIVKITTSLIQLDLVVTGKDGRPITGLKKEDFQVYQDGKLQNVTELSYFTPRSESRASDPEGKRNKNEIEPPTGTRSVSGRIITFVLDDGNCLSTIEGNSNMRSAIKRFVDDQMLPDDRVAIYRTKGGTSLLQIYTSDKDVLRKKITKLNLLAPGGCGSAFDNSTPRPNRRASPIDPNRPASPIERDPTTEMYLRERDNQLIGTLGVLGFVVERLKSSPQRKEIFLLSEGFATNFDTRSHDALRELADKAARASVVIHSLSNKGLDNLGIITAADGVRPGDTERISSQRIDEANALNGGLSYLAYTTGGKFVSNRTYLETEIKRILDVERGYYLIGYEPDDATFRGKAFHKIDVKVNRPDLRVISRKGFFGRTDKDSKPVYKTADSPLFQALSSPFQENGIDLRLTMLYGNSIDGGNYIRAMFHVKGGDIELTDEPGGTKKFVMDVVAVTLDEKTKVVDEFNRTYTMHLPKEMVPYVLKNGLDFSSDMGIKDPGLYSYRIAVRGGGSKRLGSAGDFVEVPDLKKRKFFISGLVATSIGPDGNPILTQNRPPDAAFSQVLTKASPSVRQYAYGDVLVYAYTIYNAKIYGNAPSLTRQIRLFRDGNMLLDSEEKPLIPRHISDASRIGDSGNIRITDQVAPGDYALQIIVRDKSANLVSEQSIDFEVID